MLQLWLLLLLYNPLGSCFPASDMDNEESRKVLGSSVVTSVSVIMDLGNGTKKIFGDAAHESTEKQEEEGNHPMEEMPERYEFYTFNEDGDLVKRLMTLEEIQNLLASDTGMKFPGDLDNSASVFHETSENFYHTPQPSDQVFHTLEPASPDVQEVVANVQSVLAGELASRKNASLSQTTTSTASPSTTTTTTTTTEAPTTTARVTSTSTTTTTRRPPTKRPTTRRPTTRVPTTIRNTRRPPTTGSPFKRTTTTLRASPSRKPITTRHPVRRTTTTSTTTTTTTTTTTAAPTTTIASVQKSEATEQTEKMEATEGTTLTNPTSGPMETTTEMESTNRPSWTMIPLVTVAHTKQQEAFTTEMTTTNSEVEDVTTEEGDPLHELADSVSNVLSQVTHDLTSVVELNDSTEPGDPLPMKEELKDVVKTEMPGSEVVEDDKEMNTETTEMQNDRPLTEAQSLQNKDQSVIDPQSDSSEVTDTEMSDDADLVTTERDAMSPLTTEYLHEESSTKSSQTASDSPTTSAGITDVASNTDPTDEFEVANTEPVSQSEDTRTTEYDLIELVTHPTTEADNMKTSATPEDSSTIASMDGNVKSKVSTEAPSVETKEVVTDSSQQKEDEPTTKVADNEDDLPPGELTKSAIPLQQLIAGGNKLGDYSTNPNHAGFEAAPQENLGLEVTTIGLGTDMRRFVDLNNDLALRLYAHVTRDLSQRSLVLSPFAVTSLLAMVFLGARGATSGQMNDLLRLDDMVTFNPHLVYMNVTDSVVSSPGLQAAAFVRELFADESKGKVLEFYKARTRAFYDGLVEEVDFEDIADIIRQRTNELVKMQTRAKITEYLRGANLMLRPPLSALSTNFFEGVCNDASTDDRDGEMYFVVLPYIRQRRLVLVPAVVWRGEFMAGYDPQLDATAAEIRFKGKEVSLILVLPGQPGHFNSDGLSRLETRLSTKQAWSGLLRSMVPRRLDIQVPRFAHRSMFNLTAALRRMGIRDLLTPERADLGGINGRHDLYLSDFVQMNEFAPCADDGTGERHVETYPFPQRTGRPLRHWEELETSVWVNEPSTDLPLALRPRQARVPELSNNLKFERPFLYYTRHNPTGLILHMGRFNPRLLP